MTNSPSKKPETATAPKPAAVLKAMAAMGGAGGATGVAEAPVAAPVKTDKHGGARKHAAAKSDKAPATVATDAGTPAEARPAVPTSEQVRRAFESGKYPYSNRLGRRAYERDKAKLQAELLKVQIWAQETGQKFVLLFEGRDAAGKGGTIKRYHRAPEPAGGAGGGAEQAHRRGARPVVFPALHRPSADRRRNGVL